jgi:CRP/FNR family cyclic AMP-dependent transcriptional regulator
MPADQKIKQLADTWLFSTCTRKELGLIARSCDDVEGEPGQVLCTEGSYGREMFIIRDGQATVRRNGRKVATLGPGDYFGELSLLSRLPRNATITADTDMRLLVMDQRELAGVLDQVPAIARKMLEVMAHRLSESDARTPG